MYTRICDWENLRLAHRKAARGKRGKHAAAAFEYNLVAARIATGTTRTTTGTTTGFGWWSPTSFVDLPEMSSG